MTSQIQANPTAEQHLAAVKSHPQIAESIQRVEKIIQNWTIHSDPTSLLAIEVLGCLRDLLDRQTYLERQVMDKRTPPSKSAQRSTPPMLGTPDEDIGAEGLDGLDDPVDELLDEDSEDVADDFLPEVPSTRKKRVK